MRCCQQLTIKFKIWCKQVVQTTSAAKSFRKFIMLFKNEVYNNCMHWLKLESHRVLTWCNFKLKVKLICGELGDISVTMAAIVRPDGFSIFQCCHCFEWLLTSCKRSSDAWCGLCSVYVLRFLEYNKTTCNYIKTYGGRYWTKQDHKTQNRNTKLETESQNPIQKHKTQNRITKPKTETQNSKQNHKTQNGNTKPKTEIQNR